MLCERCQKRQATVHYTQIINGSKTELNLCEECAREIGQIDFGSFNFPIGNFMSPFETDMSFESLLSGLTNNIPEESPLSCDVCKTSYEDFRRTGRLGCMHCYEVFRDRLDPLIRKIHGNNVHKGKVPKKAGGNMRLEREIEQLKAKLNDLVKAENYEEAAKVRDEIKEIEKRIGG